MTTTVLLLMIISATIAGDYYIKSASLDEEGLSSGIFFAGMSLYALPAIGWFFLMKGHSLATIGIIYSGSNIIILSALGYFVFKEAVTARDLAGIALAIAAIFMMSDK